MPLNYSELIELAKKISLDDTIPVSKIPDLDLYVDQITTLMEEYLANYKRDDEDKIITKTMVNNYTKDRVLPPPFKKKYSKHHTLMLILIYHLKQSLSIGDIVRLNATISPEETIDVYESFLEIQKEEKNNLIASMALKQEKIKELLFSSQDKKSETLLMILSLIVDANIKKQMACRIIDEYFSDMPFKE